MNASAALAGVRVALTRSADRAGALADALAAAGAEPVLLPVIDFEVADGNALGAAMERLAAGEYRWLVISSITTVRALKQWCEGAGTTLAALIPTGTQVATIGPTSVAVLAAEGVTAELAPQRLQSAAGLVELWPDVLDDSDEPSSHNRKVLLPQSDLAADTLVMGLRAKGWLPEAVTAYHTVDYPARPELRLTATLNSAAPHSGAGHEQLTPEQAKAELAAGALHAVVLASGSAARRVAALFAPLPPDCLVIAIGGPTHAEAQRLGLRVAATAEQPTPAGIVAALARARTPFPNEPLTESP